MSSGPAPSAGSGIQLLILPAAFPKPPFMWAPAVKSEPLAVVKNQTPLGPPPPARILVLVPEPRTRMCCHRKLLHCPEVTPLLVAVFASSVYTTVGVGEIPPPLGA